MRNSFCKLRVIRRRRAVLSFIIAFALVFTSLFIVAPAVPMVAEQAGLTAHAAGPDSSDGKLLVYKDDDFGNSLPGSELYIASPYSCDSSAHYDSNGGYAQYLESETYLSVIPAVGGDGVMVHIPDNTLVLNNYRGAVAGDSMNDLNIMLIGDSSLSAVHMNDNNYTTYNDLTFLTATGTPLAGGSVEFTYPIDNGFQGFQMSSITITTGAAVSVRDNASLVLFGDTGDNLKLTGGGTLTFGDDTDMTIPADTILFNNYSGSKGMLIAQNMNASPQDLRFMLMGKSNIDTIKLMNYNFNVSSATGDPEGVLVVTGDATLHCRDINISSGRVICTGNTSFEAMGAVTVNGGSLTLRDPLTAAADPDSPVKGERIPLYHPENVLTHLTSLTVNGGTVAINRNVTLPDESPLPVPVTPVPVIIDGGSVNLGNSTNFATPVNAAGDPLTSATIQFEGADNDILVSAMHITAPGGGDYPYGTNDMRTDEEERVYIWAPTTSVIVSATLDLELFEIDMVVGLQSVKIIPVRDTDTNEVKYTVTVTANGPFGTARANGSKFSAGETVVLTCSPYTGYQFSSWSAAKATLKNSTAAETTFEMPSADVSVICYFIVVPVTSIESGDEPVTPIGPGDVTVISKGSADASVTSVKSSVRTVYVQKGKPVSLPYIAHGASGTKTILTWKASVRSVASVVKNAASGTLRPSLGATSKLSIRTFKVGTSKITLTSSNQKSLVVKVVVVKKRIKARSVGIGALPKKLIIKKGRSLSLTMKLKPYNTTGAIPSWRSSNSKVLKIDPFGRITAVKAGTAKITLSAGGKKKTVKIEVQ